jgi:hypothetical protein
MACAEHNSHAGALGATEQHSMTARRLCLVALSNHTYLLQDRHQLPVPVHHNDVLLLNDVVVAAPHLQVW